MSVCFRGAVRLSTDSGTSASLMGRWPNRTISRSPQTLTYGPAEQAAGEGDTILQRATACQSGGGGAWGGVRGPRGALHMPRRGGVSAEVGRRTTVSGPGPVLSPTSAFGIFQLFLAPSPCSLASCHFSGSCCQNCRCRLLWGSVQFQACPLGPSPLFTGWACASTHTVTQRRATAKVTKTPPPPKSDQPTTKQEFKENHEVKSSPLSSAQLKPRMGHGFS